MLNTKMTNEVDWNVEHEIQLFYAMMGHKPVGVNKHFQMMFIHNKLSSSLNCELSSQTIWKKLETLYDLSALRDNEQAPDPQPSGPIPSGSTPGTSASHTPQADPLPGPSKPALMPSMSEEDMDESDKLPFPNDENDFNLPDGEFLDLLDEKSKSDLKDDEKEIRGRGRPAKKEKDKSDEGPRQERVREIKEDDDDTPRRPGKRGRDSKPSSPAHTPSSKRRRN